MSRRSRHTRESIEAARSAPPCPAVPFPVEVLPSPLARSVREVAGALPCPPDFVAVPMLALLGWLFGWIFVLFFPFSQGLNQLMNFTGILLFAGLTVWDTNRLKQLSVELEGKQGMGGLVVIGALALYLDFINLFLLLLRTSRR